MKIDIERLKGDVLDLAKIGKDEDHGLYRMAFTEADMEGKRWLADRIEAAGLLYEMDGAANVFGRIEAGKAQTILIGSHIDTVPCAGALDGALGVLTGLECLRRIEEEGIELTYNLEVVAFSDEEGRFGGLFGSQAFCGMISPQTLQQQNDLDGRTLEVAMRDCGLDPLKSLEAHRNAKDYHAYLELHIEQGPVLTQMQREVGIVESIVGLQKWMIRIRGEANHAGTTPMELRNDAFMGLADFAHELPRILEENGTVNSRATIGKAQILPGAPNTVPGLVEFSLDVRDASEDALYEIMEAVYKALGAICRKRNLRFEYEVQSEIKSADCDSGIIEKMERSAVAQKMNFTKLLSGAAHDAQIMSTFCPVGMIFVPSKDGKSHTPAEWSSWHDIEIGANLMLGTLLEMNH